MNCEQFQRALPQIIESGGDEEQEAHLSSCQACSELVRDLKYIADQAKLLLPMRDPSPRVWSNIQQSLAREGLIQEGRMSLLGHTTTTTAPKKKSWTPLGIALATLAVLVLAALLVNYRPTAPTNQEAIAPAADPGNNDGASFDGNDLALVRQISQQSPDVGSAYETNLKEVNSYIADAKQEVNDNPEDAAAQEQLKDAYEQKAMLYEMATTRSLD